MNNTVKMTGQQGDVLLRKLHSFPAGKKKLLSKGKLILAEGETTGHFHGLEETDSEMYQVDDSIIIELKNDATLTHQEHAPITLEKGIWEVGRVQEYDYFSQMKRPVMD